MQVKRISKYDLADDVRNYLIDLFEETQAIIKENQFHSCDCSSAEITYARNINDFITGKCEGIDALYSVQKHKIKEQPKLRFGTKNYIKKYYQNGKVLKIDCYVDGIPDISFFAYYEGNRRYLFPSRAGGIYTIVSVYDGESVTEEYMVNESQIIYYGYNKADGGSIQRVYINYAPGGSYPILGCEIGIFVVSEQIEYKPISEYSWYSEFDAKRRNAEYFAPHIPIMKCIYN